MRLTVTAAILSLTLVSSATACSGSRGRPSANAPADGPVMVFGTSWCAHTAEARAYLAAHRVPLVFRDVERDPMAMDEMQRIVQDAGLVYQGSIPVLVVRGRVLVGYDAHTLDDALGE